MTKKTKSNLIWGGRFSSAPDQLMKSINCSVDFDKRLYKQDISASIVHARMLVETEIISPIAGSEIESGLNTILKEIEDGKFVFKQELEDIHMNIEGRLYDLIGSNAGLLHTARSRNDQVATDFKMWTRDAIDEIISVLKQTLISLYKLADTNQKTIMPGFTHLQIAQPITFAHHILAYMEMFSRDLRRYTNARSGLNECPLGAAALAGTSFPIDRTKTASELGFDRPMSNSIDAVSDRDFCLEFLSASSICAMHMSRLTEEIVIWTSAQFNFVKLSDGFTTGSSIMPQKRNPDAAELVRGKSGRVYGSLMGLLTVIKGLPLAYSKDLQEDKEAVFDTFDTMIICLRAINGMISDIQTNKEAMEAAASQSFSTATDLADWLVRDLGKPFREAHKITGNLVKLAEEKNCELNELDLKTFKKVEPGITASVYSVLGVKQSIGSRNSLGGTSFAQVKNELRRWKEILF